MGTVVQKNFIKGMIVSALQQGALYNKSEPALMPVLNITFCILFVQP